MRSIWKGSISFGLVSVPTAVYSATHSHDLPLHQVHAKDGGRIRQERHCEVCGELVEWQDIVKAYDDGTHTVVLTADDLDQLPTERSREIAVQQFVPTEQLDPLMLDKSYYLAPASSGAKPYVLLCRTLEETQRTAIVSFTMRQKTRLGALRVRDGVLVLQTMLWADEVREPDFTDAGDVTLTKQELAMSAQLVEAYSGDFDPEQYSDDYQEQLRTLVEHKLEHGEDVSSGETFPGPHDEEGGEVVDLMEALRRSVAQSSEKTSSGSGSKGSGAKKAATKELTTAKKKPASKGTKETKGAKEMSSTKAGSKKSA